MTMQIIYAILALGISVWGIILLIKLLNNLSEEKLTIWLDFTKFFLGTFIIGLLGYFAKLSFDNRNLAIMESDQIGKYVEQAMVDDIEVRLRFAEYFNTVLPEDRRSGWDTYYNMLKDQQKIVTKRNDTISKIQDTINSIIDSMENIVIEDSTKAKEQQERLAKLYEKVDKKTTENDRMKKLAVERPIEGASILNPAADFVTCRGVNNRIPINVSSTLPRGRVYAFARVHTPTPENVTLNWYDYKGQLVPNGTKSFYVTKNETTGYRLYSWKNFADKGAYSVELVNQAGQVIGKRDFEIK